MATAKAAVIWIVHSASVQDWEHSAVWAFGEDATEAGYLLNKRMA